MKWIVLFFCFFLFIPFVSADFNGITMKFVIPSITAPPSGGGGGTPPLYDYEIIVPRNAVVFLSEKSTYDANVTLLVSGEPGSLDGTGIVYGKYVTSVDLQRVGSGLYRFYFDFAGFEPGFYDVVVDFGGARNLFRVEVSDAPAWQVMFIEGYDYLSDAFRRFLSDGVYRLRIIGGFLVLLGLVIAYYFFIGRRRKREE